MAELVAVNDMFSLIDFTSFKRQALMFDRIAFPNLRRAVDRLLAEHHEVIRCTIPDGLLASQHQGRVRS
jgi:hypothetical protein